MNILPVDLQVVLGQRGECAMILVQPDVKLRPVPNRGFGIDSQAERAKVLNVVRNARQIATSQVSQDYQHAHFLIFPELSVTIEAFEELEQFVRGPQCPDNFIVIMGLEGLAWSYFEALLDRSDNPGLRHKPAPGTVDWVNCFVVLAKELANTGGHVKLFVQSKFEFSAWEQTQDRFFRGEDLLLFKIKTAEGVDSSFFGVICSDCSMQRGGSVPLMQALTNVSAVPGICLDRIFVLQHNPGPRTTPFDTAIRNVLSWQNNGFNPENTSLVLLNCSAENNLVRSEYGETSIIYNRAWWTLFGANDPPPVTYSLGQWPGDCRQARFRVKTPAVFNVTCYSPRNVGHANTAPRQPFKDATCRLLDSAGALVAAAPTTLQITWENLLDQTQTYREGLRHSAQPMPALTGTLQSAIGASEQSLRGIPGDRLTQITSLLLNAHNPVIANPDFWDRTRHGQAMACLIHSVGLMQTGGHAFSFGNGDEIVTGTAGGRFKVAIIDGDSQLTRGQLLQLYQQARAQLSPAITSTVLLTLRTDPAPNPDSLFVAPDGFMHKTTAASNPLTDGDMVPENAHFEPAKLYVGCMDGLQRWKEKPSDQEANEHLRSYFEQV